MGKQVTVYFILLLTFTIGSIYNFRIRKQSIYPVRLTKPRVILMILLPLIFFSIPSYISENSWNNYILATLASIFIISAMVGEGIHEEGIYYHSPGINFLFAKLVKWEDIKDIELDISKRRLKSLKVKTETIFPDQYYYSKDIDEINKYLKIKIRNNK